MPEVPDDPSQQLALIARALAERPDAIVLVPVHPSAVAAGIADIIAADIPLVSFINRIVTAEAISFVGADDLALARAVGGRLCAALGGRGLVVLVEGPPSSTTSAPRDQGFREAIARHPGIRIVGRCNGRFLREAAREALQDLLAGLPDVDAILAANDDMALGALDALAALGRRARVAGVNAVPEAVAAIRRGDMVLSADFNAMQMGYYAVHCAVRHLRGEAVPKELLLPVHTVDRANCAAWDRPYAERQCAPWAARTPPDGA